MPLQPPQAGRIITFYSYKGGTGRSMALANVACLLAKGMARTSQRVLVMDWDLEAPGLHRFFSAKSDLPEYEKQPGVIDYFLALQQMLEASPGLIDEFAAPDGWRVLDGKLPLEHFLIPDVVGGVDFMRAGRFDGKYPKLVGAFDWIEFFQRYGAAILTFRELLINKYGYALVDSRTGLTDVSGICTTLLPEKLVGVFTPNRQSLRGLCEVVKQAVEYRSKSDDFRPLSVFPLPSRVENAEKDLREQWRKRYQNEFEELFRSLYGSEQCDLSSYFDTVLLPHVSYYAYGENIAVLQERPDAISLSGAYQRFFERLTTADFAWEVPGRREAPAASVDAAVETAKPVEEKYDAFLSCVPNDAKEVSQVNYQLRRQGARCFFALNDVAPGEDAAASVSKAMAESKTILMFVGPTGSGSWKDQESVTVLENYVKDGSKRVIPVLLPKAPNSDKLRLPNFLRNVQWVDLRSGLDDPEAMGNLIWGLTGKRPVAVGYGRLSRTTLALGCMGLLLVSSIVVLLWPRGGSKMAASDRDAKLKQQAIDLWQNRQFDQAEQIWQGLAKAKGPLQNEALQQVVQIEQKRGDEQRRFDEGEALLKNRQDYASAQKAFQDVIHMNLWHAEDAAREMDAFKAGLSVTDVHKQEQDHFDEAVKQYQAKDFDKARKEFKAMLDLNVAGSPLKPQAESYLAKIRQSSSDQKVYDTAVQDMQEENWTEARDQFQELIGRNAFQSADAKKQLPAVERGLHAASSIDEAIRSGSFRAARAQLDATQEWPKTHDRLLKDLQAAEQQQFDAIKSNVLAAEAKGDSAGIQRVQDDLHSFEARAQDPSLIAASKDLEKGLNAAYSAAISKSGDKAAFDAAVAHFEQARQKKDIDSLSHGVSQEFEKIASGPGIYRDNAALYVKTTIPNAIQALTLTTSGKLILPALSCGSPSGPANAPPVGGSVSCEQLDPASALQWVGIATVEFPDIASQPGKLPYTLTVIVTVEPNGNVKVDKVGNPDQSFFQKVKDASKNWKTTTPKAEGKPVSVRFPLTITFQR